MKRKRKQNDSLDYWARGFAVITVMVLMATGGFSAYVMLLLATGHYVVMWEVPLVALIELLEILPFLVGGVYVIYRLVRR